MMDASKRHEMTDYLLLCWTSADCECVCVCLGANRFNGLCTKGLGGISLELVMVGGSVEIYDEADCPSLSSTVAGQRRE